MTRPVGRPVGRRAVLVAGLGLGAAGLAGGTVLARRDDWPELKLYQAGVGIEPDGDRVLIPVGAREAVPAGSRVLTGSGSPEGLEQARAERDWLQAGTVPTGQTGPTSRWSGMAVDALLDLRTLLLDDGALVASWARPWRYVWPRDASFGAVALSVAGHPGDASSILLFLQRMQRPDGLFDARYRPDGSGVPDNRGIQRDGSGWALWAVLRVVSALPAAERPAALRLYRGLIDRSAAAVVSMAGTRSGLPPPSRDYWEVAENRTTLGIAAPVLTGLRAAAVLYRDVGRPDLAGVADRAAGRMAASIGRAFGPTFTRHPGSGERDAAVTFLCPPLSLTSGLLSGPASAERIRGAGGRGSAGRIVAARHAAERALIRPAGGLAPGSGWRSDGASWTPETALFALAAAGNGEVGRAAGWLDWLSSHRTAIGALPEKVLADGSPAGPAPLAWTAALVLLTLHQLKQLDGDGTDGASG